ncbi:MAG: CaiB/BaiF CoA-transferase family protein [Pseudomonadota bacterium]
MNVPSQGPGERNGPLAGIRVLEFEGIGPVPYAGMLLADLGADVLKIARPAVPSRGPLIADQGEAVLDRGKRVVTLDLKSVTGLDTARALAAEADGLLEGLRPGVMERLGLGPGPLRACNPRLVYVRVTGWGQDGPLSQTAGHDINYIALAGALGLIGQADCPPPPPANLVGDFGGGGLIAALGLLAGVIQAGRSGQGAVVDSAMIDGTASQMALIFAWYAAGLWQDRRESNLLDGAAPFYRCYRCACGGHVAVGAIEPAFFADLMAGLGLEGEAWDQADRSRWPDLAARIAGCFATRSRDAWAAHFAGTDACVTPVLGLAEVADHPHIVARQASGLVPPAPRFPGSAPGTEADRLDAQEALARWQRPRAAAGQ